jgi:glycosyltransferase involved in cell wall biosynthesis
MKLSVVICTRNRAHAIVNCLDSIDFAARNASLTDAEIVVSDNGSSDGTPGAVRNWAASASIRVCVEHEPRAGITLAKNRGLRAARGDILVLIDDDCCLQPDYFVELLRLHATDTTKALNCFLGCNLFMRRSVYERLGPFDERFGVGSIPAGEDTDYIFRAYIDDCLL